MASPYVFLQASTPANSKRKASGVPNITPPRRYLPPWDKKLTALEHCCAGDLAETQLQQSFSEGADNSVAQHDNECAGQKPINKLTSNVGSSRDTVMAKMRLLQEAHQRLIGGSRDVSVRYGKEKLSLSEILPISDELGKLFHGKENLDMTNAVIVQRDELQKEKDDLAEQIKVAQRDQMLCRRERDSYLLRMNSMKDERDRLLQEQSRHHQELEILKGERDKFQNERELLRRQLLDERAARKSAESEMVSRTILNKVEKEREQLRATSTRYRGEREHFHQALLQERVARKNTESGMVSRTILNETEKERDELMTRSVRYKKERDRACQELSEKETVLNETKEERDELTTQSVHYKQERDQAHHELSEKRTVLDEAKKERDALTAQSVRYKKERDQARQDLSETEKVLNETEKERDELTAQSTHYKEERDQAIQEGRSILKRVEEIRSKLNFSQITNATLDAQLKMLELTLEQERRLSISKIDKFKKECLAVRTQAGEDKKNLSAEHVKDILLTTRRQWQQLREVRDQTNSCVIVTAVLQSSYNDMRSAFLVKRKTVANHKDQIQALDERLAETLKDKATFEAKSDELQLQLYDNEKKLRESYTANEAKKSTILVLDEQLIDSQNDNAALKADSDRLHIQLLAKDEELQQLATENNTNKLTLCQVGERLTESQSSNATLQADSDRLHRLLSDQKEALLRLSKDNETNKLTLRQIDERLTVSQNSNATLKAESDRLHRLLSDKEEALLKLSKENETNKLTLCQIDERLTMSQNSNATLKAESDRLLTKIHSLKEDLHKLSADNENDKMTLQKVREQLEESQIENAALRAESDRLHAELLDKEVELKEKSTNNEANLLTLRQVQAAHAVCEYDRRLQLGRTNRQCFFEDFSKFAENGRVFKGQEGNRDVDLCICALPGGDEGMCVIRKLGCAFTIWHGRMEDCTTFFHDWQTWLCLGKENQGKPIYISLKDKVETDDWMRRTLARRTVSATEAATLDQIKQLS